MGVDVAEVNKCNQSSLDYIHHPISMQDINIAYFSGKTVKLCIRCWTGQLPWMSSTLYEKCLWNGGFYLLMSGWNLTPRPTASTRQGAKWPEILGSFLHSSSLGWVSFGELPASSNLTILTHSPKWLFILYSYTESSSSPLVHMHRRQVLQTGD